MAAHTYSKSRKDLNVMTPTKQTSEQERPLSLSKQGTSLNAINMKKPTVQKRPHVISKNSAYTTQKQRRSMQNFAPNKLVPFLPKDSTFYDFNQYGPRPDIFPVKIETNADYSTTAGEAFNNSAMVYNLNRSHTFAKSRRRV